MAVLYLRSGGGNYSTASTWSTTDGGGAAGAAPTASDDTNLTSTAGNATLTVDASSACRSMDCTGFTGTLVRTAGLTIGTSTVNGGGFAFKGSGTMTVSGTGTIAFAGSHTSTATITWNGVALGGGSLTFNDSSTSNGWQITDATSIASGTFSVVRGKVDITGTTVTCTTFSSTGSLTRTATLTNATVNCAGWTVSGSGFTHTLTGSAINVSSGTFAGGGQTNYATVNFTGATSTKTVTGANTIATMTYAGILVLPASTTTTVTNPPTSSGSASGHATLQSSTPGTAATLSVSSGTVTLSNSLVVDIAMSGGATFVVQNGSARGAVSGFTVKRGLQPAAAGAGR